MKIKTSASIDKSTYSLIIKAVESGQYRNKSHAIEHALKKFFEVQKL